MFDLLDWETLRSDNYLVLDVETDNGGGHGGVAQIPENKLLLACWKTPGSKTWSKWGGEFEQEELLDAIDRVDYIVAYHAKYELGWLLRCGLDIRSKPVACAMLAEHVLLGNLGTGDKYNPPIGLSLDRCVTRRGGPSKDPVVDNLIRNGINPRDIPPRWLKGRCLQDVDTTEWLWRQQRKQLDGRKQLPILWTRSTLTTPFLTDLERRGMHLDPQPVEETYEAYRKMYGELEQQMQAATGGINWRSPKQVADLLYGETNDSFEGRRKAWLEDPSSDEERGPFPERFMGLGFKAKVGRDGVENRGTGKQVLESLHATNKAQRDFVALRNETSKVGNALTKALEFFRGVCHERGGRFLAEINQKNVATHRLSSTGIAVPFEMYGGKEKSAQFQNLPRVFKPLFIAGREDWLIGEWDGSQLEFRVAGHLSRDPQIKADVIAGHDVHKFTGVWMNHAPKEWLRNVEDHIEESLTLMHLVTKVQRQAAKPDTFKPVYGGKKGTARQMAYYAAFRARYSALTSTQEEWVYEVCDSPIGELITEWGMRYYWPRRRRSADGYVNVSNAVYNYPVQGFATAEIIPIAVAWFWHEIHSRGLEDYIILLNQVHDSVVCAVHPDAVEPFFDIAVKAWHFVYQYLDEAYGVKDFYVPLGTEVGVGTHWGKPSIVRAYNIWPDGREELKAA